MPIAFSLIPTAFVLFGLGVEVARVTSRTHRPEPKAAHPRPAPALRTKQGAHSSFMGRNPTSLRCGAPALKDAVALPLGFGRGEFSFGDSLLSHAASLDFFYC
jgi:hypothetical protein